MPWLEIKIMEIKDIAATVSNKCVANQVRQLNRSLSRIYDEQLRPHGMKISQFTILVAIANGRVIFYCLNFLNLFKTIFFRLFKIARLTQDHFY